MKSDEEFIAGIYQKAKERKIEEETAAQNPHHSGRGRSFWAWRALAAAACLCLIVSGAVYAGNLRKKAGESSGMQQGEQSGDSAVMALSLEGSGIPIGEGDAAQGDNINPRGRIAPGDGEQQVKEGGSTVTEALWAGFWLSDPVVYPNITGENRVDVLHEEDAEDIRTGENGTDLPETGGN